MYNISSLQAERLKYSPKLPAILASSLKTIELVENEMTTAINDVEALRGLFPNTFGQPNLSFKAGKANKNEAYSVGVVLSGGPASGGHNVILGLFDALKALNPENKLLGFKKGPGGIVDNDVMEITAEIADRFADPTGRGRARLPRVARPARAQRFQLEPTGRPDPPRSALSRAGPGSRVARPRRSPCLTRSAPSGKATWT